VPNRILREGLLESSAIDLLDAEAERFFVRLMLRADDFGRYHANPAMLANMLFPLRRDIEPQMVVDWLNQCQRAKLLRVYHVDGRPCLEISKFGQRSRAQQSKFPSPPTDDGQMTDICLTDDGHPRTYSYSSAYSSSSARAKAVSPPSLDEVIAEGAKRQIPADICQRWFNACEERPITPDGGWTLRNGQPMNMAKWSSSLANYASAFKSNEVAFGANGKNGAKKPPSVWELQQRIEAAQKEIDRISSNPSNKEQIPDSFDRRLRPEPMAQVKSLKARISQMRAELAGVEQKEAA
jgi:hypothetical protein